MRVYEISEEGGKISSESRTEEPRKKGNALFFIVKNCKAEIALSRP